ncbi:MAG: hypothetical protein KF712_16440 [Akkermansiaceae bacterium]|nr:hypothetical protein [Akkermansiaceae bacterium]
MSEDPPDTDLRADIARWQKKYHIADGDPALACLELFDLYVSSLRQRTPDGPPLRFEEFRSTMELLDSRSKGFAKHASELIQELRQATQAQRQLRRVSLLSVVLTAIATFAVGLLTGIFVW